MVTNDMTVAHLLKMGISLDSLNDFIEKELKRSKRAKAKEQRKAEMADVAIKVLEVLNSDPGQKWKTGNLVSKIFGITRSNDSEKENERYRVHGLISSALKDMSEKGSISKLQVGGNSCHTWYQSTLPVPEAEFTVSCETHIQKETASDIWDYQDEIDFQEEIELQDEEDYQEYINSLIEDI